MRHRFNLRSVLDHRQSVRQPFDPYMEYHLLFLYLLHFRHSHSQSQADVAERVPVVED